MTARAALPPQDATTRPRKVVAMKPKKKVLRLGKRVGWRTQPVVFEVVGGSRPYVWLGEEDEDSWQFWTAMTAGDARRLARFITEHFGE